MDDMNDMWVARNKNGELNFFVNEPYRYVFGEYTNHEKHVWLCDEYNVCHTPLPESMFPELRWEDEPIKVEVKKI